MTRHNPMRAIEARQRQEDEQRTYNRVRAENTRQRLVATWENRGESVISQKDLMRHLDHVQAAHNDALVARRQRLAELLLSERETHAALLSRLAETDEQRRERLIQKARELRAQQAAELRAESEKRHDRLFRERIDTLRLAESRLKVMQVADARFEQLALRQRRAEAAVGEADFFAQQRAALAEADAARARRDLSAAKRRADGAKAALDAQCVGNAARRRAEAAARRGEAEAQRAAEREWAETERGARRAEAARRAAVRAEMDAFREAAELARRQEYARLRAEERAALDALLADMRRDAQREAEAKTARQHAARAHMEDVRAQMRRKGDEAESLERLWDEANAKEWGKREACWNADAQKRDALLRSVLIARREQVLEKRRMEKDSAEDARREHEAFLQGIANIKDIDAEERARRYALLKENQKYLEGQMQRRADERETERRARQEELSEQEALEAKYAERIKREMENLEKAKPERYKDVPLLPKQRYKPF